MAGVSAWGRGGNHLKPDAGSSANADFLTDTGRIAAEYVTANEYQTIIIGPNAGTGAGIFDFPNFCEGLSRLYGGFIGIGHMADEG